MNLTRIAWCAAAVVCLSLSAAGQDIEPNDQPEKASAVKFGQAITGTWNSMDQSDYYKFVLPATGIVTVTLSGYPSDCSFQVGVMGFQKSSTAVAGWAEGQKGKPLTFSFVAQGGKEGYVWVRLTSIVTGLAGADWTAVRCSQNGPWYHTPVPGYTPKNLPAAHEGAPMKGPITYQLKLTMQNIADQWEPNFEPGMTRPEMLKKGIVKTIPIGKEISAFLFNDTPALMRGTPGSEDASGGENDIDIYHVHLDAADTVKVALRDVPQNANLKIVIYHPNGWDESKKGETTAEADVKAAGDVFIEVSKGRDDRPLVWSATPYKLLVTTGRTPAQPQPEVRPQPQPQPQPGPQAIPTVVTAGPWGTIAIGNAASQESEPNDKPDAANPIQLNAAMNGMWHAGDQYDYYKLTLPSSGIVNVNLTGYPADCVFQVGITGFQKHETTTGGWAKNETGKPLTFSFAAQGGKPGCIWVRLSNVASATASGDWSAVRCSKAGPWYFTPKPGQANANLPPAYDGAPVQGPIKYELKLAFQPMVDEYEPNFEAGVKREDMLKQGIIKTIPVGQEIKALLFNDYPAVMRGAPGNENASGGEDDTDLYHVRLDAPDKVKVTLGNLPEKANVKAVVYHPNGWDESKAGEKTVEADVRTAGDIFIEVSRGRENRPLTWSAEPYTLLVTTGAAQPSAGGTKQPEAGGDEFEELLAKLNEIEPFPDELEALKRFEADPRDANRKALIAVRMRYAVALGVEAERTADPEMHARALFCAESALQLAPNDPTLLTVLARVYMASKHSRPAQLMAEDALRAALRIAPNDNNARLLLGQALLYQARYKQAIDEFQKAIGADPAIVQPPVVMMVCSAYALDLRPQEGVEFFRGILKKHPGADSARIAVALLLKQQGKEKEAVAELQQLMQRESASAANRQYAWQLIQTWKNEAK
jgi:tetratricopeptide (TPR) repeat protein